MPVLRLRNSLQISFLPNAHVAMRISEKFKIVSVELLKSGWFGVRVAETNYKIHPFLRQHNS